MQQTITSLPVISIDNDGVVSKSKQALPKVKETFQLIRQDLNQLDPKKFGHLPSNFKLPIQFVTNAGGCIEACKAIQINQMLDLTDSKSIQPDELVLNFTPLKEEMLKFKDQIVLISGTEDFVGIAVECQLNKYITFYEYARLYPFLVPINELSEQEIQETRNIIKQRLNMPDLTFEEPLQINAIFYLYDSYNLEIIFQITIDLLTTENGTMAQYLPDIGPKKHIPIYSVVNDFLFPTNFRLHRMGFGIFLDTLKDLYRKILKQNLEITECGKPSKMTFEYAEKNGIKMASPYKVSNFYMIGDNPKTDIKGAKKQGWYTILVRTGLYKDGDQLGEDAPDAIVDDFQCAIQLIFKLEGIQILQ